MKAGARWVSSLALTAMVLGGTSRSEAQLQSGSLYGIITDTRGNPMSGVSVTLSGGEDGTQCKTTDEKGQIRFLHLDPGRYSLTAEMDGFSRVVFDQVSIRIGRNTTVQLQMSEVLEETITVTTEPPLLDPSDLSSTVTVTEFELDEIPTDRDPWGLVRQAPGVVTDRINVGGSESGQQALFVGPGSSSRENSYVVDGVNITDMAAVGATPAYYDFDQFGEINISTGGADISSSTAGVTLNLVTKRGTDRWRGSARLFVTDGSWEASPEVDRRDFGPGQEETSTNRVRGMEEHGLEVGGPLVPDHLWAWGAYAKSNIDRLALGGLPDDIDLENVAFKLNFEAVGTTSGVVSLNASNKDRFGRGASIYRSPASLWDQTGGADLYKVEISHQFGHRAMLEAMVSRLDSDFFLDPRGGPNTEIYQDENGVWQGSFVAAGDSRDVDQVQLSGSRYVDGHRVGHELSGEVQRRSFRYDGFERWGPRNLVHYSSENTSGVELVEAMRPGGDHVEQNYTSAWIQDLASATARTTLVFGLRYDVQDAANLAGSAPAHQVFPDLLPGTSVPRRDAGFTWRLLSPRMGVTHSIGVRSQSLLRASYSRFPSQLYTDLAVRVSPSAYAGAVFEFDDLNGNHIFDDTEPHRLLNTYGIDPKVPGALSSANVNDRNLEPEVTDELLLGFEYLVTPRISLGLDVTHRRIDGILENRRLVQTADGVRLAERTDFVRQGVVEGELPNGGGRFQAPIYTLDGGVAFTGGSVLTNGDRVQEYNGLNLSATRRMSGGWMLRGHVNWNDWRWRVGEEFLRFDDPTDAAIAMDSALISNVDTPGDVVAEPSRSREETQFLNSRWQFSVVGLYEVAPRRPWAFNVAANVHGRDGFPGPYRVVVVPRDGLRREVQVTSKSDAYRFDDIVLADLRLDKELRFGRMGAVLSLDVFNLLNSSFELERSLQLNGPQPDFLLRTTSPRVFRIGIRLHWDP